MGTITVKYASMRGDDMRKPETRDYTITDTKDWFDAITDERYWEQIKPKYDALSED